MFVDLVWSFVIIAQNILDLWWRLLGKFVTSEGIVAQVTMVSADKRTMIPLLMVVGHYILYAIAKNVPQRLRSYLVYSGVSIDRGIWLSVSLGASVGWTILFWPVTPLGDATTALTFLGKDDLASRVWRADSAIASMALVFLYSFPFGYIYYYITGLTSNSEPPGFRIRKLIPVIVVFASLIPPHPHGISDSPARTLLLVGWLLQCTYADAFSDVLAVANSLVSRSSSSSSSVFIGVLRGLSLAGWAVTLWQMRSVYRLTDHVIGAAPYWLVSAMTVYVQIKESLA